jgi:hypothetical protein
MGEYMKILRYAEHDSEQYTRAVFMAAITMTHEIGNVIYHQDFHSGIGEPHAGSDCSAELGFSFVSWLFSGYHPQFETGKDGKVDFGCCLYWEPQYITDMPIRPLYKTLYSVPMRYIEEKLDQCFWDTLGGPERQSFFVKAKQALCPDLMPKGRVVATSRVPNFQ